MNLLMLLAFNLRCGTEQKTNGKNAFAAPFHASGPKVQPLEAKANPQCNNTGGKRARNRTEV